MGDLALLAGLALGGVAIFVWGTDAVVGRREAGLWLVAGTTALRAASDGNMPGATFSGYSVYFSDVVLGILLVASVARLLRGWRMGPLHGGIMALVALVVFSLLRGFGVFDLATVLNEARDTLLMFAAVLYFAVDPSPAFRNYAGRVWTGLAGLLLLLAFARWAAIAAGVPWYGNWRDEAAYGGLRVLSSDETLVLVQAFLLLLPRWLDGTLSRLGRRATVTIGAAVLVLQHRSVWVCLVVGLVALYLQETTFRQRGAFRLGAVAVACAALVVLVSPGDMRQQERLAEIDAAGTGTFEWRIEGWRRLAAQAGPDGPFEVAVGVPYGTGWERDLGPYVTDVAPHNYYVEMGLRVGLVGLLALMLLYGATIVRLFTSPRPAQGLLNDRTLVTLLVTQLVYYIPYWPRVEQGVLLGLAVGAAAALRGRSGPAGALPPQPVVLSGRSSTPAR